MNFDESSTVLVSQEFTAVVLAGFGNELLPLTGNNGDETCPKALLPIANKPMIEYPLAWIEQSGIRDVLLICPAPHRSALSNYIQSDSSTSFPSLRIDLQTYDETQESAVGTCSILRHFSQRIQHDFVLLPCDFVPPDSLPLSQIVNKFRTESTYDGSIATACFYEARRPEKAGSSDEWGVLPSPVSIVWDERTGTLLYIDTPDDVDKNGEEIELRMSLLSQYPRAKLCANMNDSHTYVCRRHVLDALQEKTRLDSIREEFIPWLCKPQYQRTRREKYGSVLSPLSNTSSQGLALRHSTIYTDIHRHHHHYHRGLASPVDPGDGLIRSVAASPVDEAEEATVPSLRVGLLVHRAEQGYAARANTLHAYLELNRHFLAQTTYSLPTDSRSRSLIDQKAQISSDSMIGLFTRVDERTTVKKSVIGQHCVIGKMARIVGCVILDHCVVEDGAKLDGCILGKNTKVEAKAELSRCVTQAGYEVGTGETFKNEKLEVTDWTAETQSSDEDEDKEQEDSPTGDDSD
ncbi:Probable translation initiation factor eIF-2B subunit [Sparassis crispa]|uniref:Translation initiation factor eIF2B subunit gamma n=1 Tax=Sparassis crispa TaxID=139825 RepID=A0A401GFM2_9APHY|nr:Probable translation initiation factor eIF-2B subunit [Sparassis crispa]GBE80970.1 Probable translation initiation factor eIF-2B subunit [Sparassis crispa]